MIAVSLIISIIALATSLFKTIGIIVSVISLILGFILLKIYWSVEYKKRTLIIGIILSTVAIINSFVFTVYSDTLGNFLNTSGQQAINSTKNTRLLQDYSTVKNCIAYYKSSHQNVNKLLGAQAFKIYNTSSSIINYPEQIKTMMAISDTKTKYYNINFTNLDFGILISNKTQWLIDNQGNVYLNIEDYTKY